MDSRTPYVETEILLAVLDNDDDSAERMLRDMFDGELASFDRKASWMQTLIFREQKHRRRQAEARVLREITEEKA